MSIKVLQIINSLKTGGAEKLVADSVPLFQEKGVKMDVLCLDNEETPFKAHLRENSTGSVFGLTNGSIYNPLLTFKLIPYLKEYSLVHVHLFPSLYWVVLARLFSFGKTPIVYTEHSTHNKRRTHAILKHIDPLIYQSVKKVITISEEVDSALKKHLPNRNHNAIQLVQNGVKLDSFLNATAPEENELFSKEAFTLIQVSSFRYPKDHSTLIKSLLYLPETIKLLLVGDGPLKKTYEDLVLKLNLNDRIQFLGVRYDIPRLLASADVAILSSEYEGLSLSSIEGMASKPFVGSDVPGLREIINGFGLLFQKGDPKDLASQVMKLYNDPYFYTKIALQCKERAKDFDIAKMVNSYIKVYNDISIQGHLAGKGEP